MDERLKALYRYVLSVESAYSAEVYGYDHEVAAEMAGVRDEMIRLWPGFERFESVDVISAPIRKRFIDG
jgi:hypothetical protein